MYSIPNENPTETRPHDRPRSLGGFLVYLLAAPAFVVTLAAPELVLAAAFGACSAVLARKLTSLVEEIETNRHDAPSP